MRKLLLFFAMLCVSIGAWADIRVIPTTINGVSGYGIYDWTSAEDLENFLSGSYEGAIYVDGASVDNASALTTLSTAKAIKIGGAADSELVSSDALSKFDTAFPAADYIDMDKAELADDADVSKLESAAQYVALPYGADIASLKTIATGGKNPNLKAVASTDAASPTEFVGYATEAGQINTICGLGMLGGINASGNTLSNLVIGGNVNDLDFGTNGNNADWNNVGVSNKEKTSPFSTWSQTPPTIDLSEATLANAGDLASINSATTSITLPNNLTEIKAQTFKGFSKLNEVVLPNSVETVGDEAFYECYALERFTYGNGIKTVGENVYTRCNKLKTLVFTPGIEELSFGVGCFAGLSGLKHVVLPEGVTSLGDQTFYQCTALESIRLPYTLRSIGDGCFSACSKLATITIPENVTSIGKSAFSCGSAGAGLKDIYIMAKDVNHLPAIWTAGAVDVGTAINNADSSFGANKLVNNDTDLGSNPKNSGYSWEEACQKFYESRGCATLHFPADFVNAEEFFQMSISDTYDYSSTDNIATPHKDNGDFEKRITSVKKYDDAWDTENPGNSVLSKHGWAQFSLIKGFTAEEKKVLEKTYKDVWYTMCFPFDLTDEQLEEAFNAEYNICEFNNVEVKEANGSSYIVLHFNTIAAPETPESNILAKAYHPYMIHPNLGTTRATKTYFTNLEFIPEVPVTAETPYCDGSVMNVKSKGVKQTASYTDPQGTTTTGSFYFIGNVDDPSEVVTEDTEMYNGREVAENGESGTTTISAGSAKGIKLIPYGAYFLGTAAGATYPKYWRETSEDYTRTTGKWSQYAAVVLSDQKLEEALYTDANNAKSFDIDFTEYFSPETDEAGNTTDLKEIIKEAESKNLPVQFVNIVYNINGQVVKTENGNLEGLPKGMYIVNGKKYLVK